MECSSSKGETVLKTSVYSEYFEKASSHLSHRPFQSKENLRCKGSRCSSTFIEAADKMLGQHPWLLHSWHTQITQLELQCAKTTVSIQE